MAGRIYDNRNFTLPDLNDSTGSASPVSSLSPLPKPQVSSKPNNYQDNQFVLPTQAFVPIKDGTTVQKEAKKRELESIFQQQTKLQEKVRDLELSNQQLIAEVNSIKRNNKDVPVLDGQTEHALRNATDMTLYLTKKLQNMHEAITKLEVRVQQQEKNLQEEKGGLAALADKVVEIESTGASHLEEQLTKQGNELLMYRDSLQDLKKKILDEQHERKNIEQRIFDLIQRSKEDNQQQFQQHQQQLFHLQQKQPTPPQPPPPPPPPQHQPVAITPQLTITPKIEERIVEIAENVFKRHKPTPPPPQSTSGKGKSSSDMERLLQDELNRIGQLESDLRRGDNKRWTEFKKEQEQEIENIHQTVKVDRSKLNQEFKTIRESISLLADKQIDHHKSMQEKLQAEILTRQQFECDTLRQMTMLDEKLIKLGSNYLTYDPKKSNSGKSELMLREVDSLKKMILDTERNLEQKIENSVSKLKPNSNTPTTIAKKPIENDDKHLEYIEEQLEKCRLAGVKNTNDIKKLDVWKANINDGIEEIKQDVERLKVQTKKLSTSIPPPPPSPRDGEVISDINKKIRILNESADDYKIFKETTADALENLKKKMKLLNESANKTPANKTGSSDAHSSVSPQWKEQMELSIEDAQKEIKHLKEKIAQHEQKILNVRNELEQETKQRVDDVEEVREEIKRMKPSEAPPHVENKSNSAKEGLKRLANALQGTKNVLAMKMQYEEKERQGADEFLQKQIDEINNLIDEHEKKLANDKKPKKKAPTTDGGVK